MTNDQPATPAAMDHPIAHHPSLALRLHGRLDVLIGRLHLDHVPPEEQAALATTLHEVITRIEAAESSAHAHEWILALRVAQNCEPALRQLVATAHERQRAAPDRANHLSVVEALWAWLITQA